jgi:2-deoxy-D-gluconate 3-dehydrogenase
MILDQFKLDGKTALVTGASRGLGEGMALALAQAGANIVGVARGENQALVETVQALGRRIIWIPADLSDRAESRALLGKAEAQGMLPDILVNNAGVIRRADLADFTEELWDEVLEINLSSIFVLCKDFAVRRAGRGGRIINTASMLSFQGGIRVFSYTASKTGLVGLTRILANELAAAGITVNAIAPGYMATDNTLPLRQDPKRNAEILARIPAGRWGAPEDLSGAVVFLASDAAAYMTGQVLAVDGGWLSR